MILTAIDYFVLLSLALVISLPLILFSHTYLDHLNFSKRLIISFGIGFSLSFVVMLALLNIPIFQNRIYAILINVELYQFILILMTLIILIFTMLKMFFENY